MQFLLSGYCEIITRAKSFIKFTFNNSAQLAIIFACDL